MLSNSEKRCHLPTDNKIIHEYQTCAIHINNLRNQSSNELGEFVLPSNSMSQFLGRWTKKRMERLDDATGLLRFLAAFQAFDRWAPFPLPPSPSHLDADTAKGPYIHDVCKLDPMLTEVLFAESTSFLS